MTDDVKDVMEAGSSNFALLIGYCVWIVFKCALMRCVPIVFSIELPIGGVDFVIQRNEWEKVKMVNLW